jgi:hypothetical protein
LPPRPTAPNGYVVSATQPSLPAPKPAVTAARPAATPAALAGSARHQAWAAVAPAAEPEVEEEPLPWDQITPASSASAARAETSRDLGKPAARGRSNSTKPRPESFQNRRMWLIGVILVGAVVLGAAAAFLIAMLFAGPATTRSTEAARPPLFVGGKGGFKTLHDALKQAKPGDHVVVRERMLEETLDLNDGKLGKHVTIETDKDMSGPFVWTLPKNAKSGRILNLMDVEGLSIQGFTLDGQNRIDDLVLLSGRCSGLVLDSLRLEGFKGTGIQIVNCAGEPNWPVTVSRVAFVGGSKEKAKAPMVVDVNPSIRLQNDNILIRDCRVLGNFAEYHVNLDASKQKGVEIVGWEVSK